MAPVMHGHADLVRELIQQVGIEGCGGKISGVHAVLVAVRQQFHAACCVDVMAILIDAGVDTREALGAAAAYGNEVAVKFLLQRQQPPERTWEASGGIAFVNANTPHFGTPLLSTLVRC